MQLARYLPDDDEQHPHPLCLPCRPSEDHSRDTPDPLFLQAVPLTGEMQIRTLRGGLPWTCHLQRPCSDGLATTDKSKGCPILHRICELLPKVHLELLQNCLPPPHAHLEVKGLVVGCS